MLTVQFWKKYFNVYDYLNELIPYSRLLNDICDRSCIKKGDKVLDLGSGTGNLSIIARKRGACVYGIDFSEVGIEINKTKYEEYNISHGDITKVLPYPNDFFDAVISNNVLYTIPREKRESIYREIYRILKVGGVASISNISEGFSSLAIYREHLDNSINQYGLIKTFVKSLILIIPTIKIIYYNYLISKENNDGKYDFFLANEQKEIMYKSGFTNVSDDIRLYADQAIMNIGYKLK